MGPRRVEAEWLDALPEGNPQAVQSRRDLRRLNRWMRHDILLARALRACCDRPAVLADLGAGDAELMSLVSWRLPPAWAGSRVLLVDRQTRPCPAALERLHARGWAAETVQSDVFAFLAQPQTEFHLVVANLFLHHFQNGELARLLHAVAGKARAFVALEPRRCRLSRFASRCVRLIGCNEVTLHDAIVSVEAGFRGRELSDAWPSAAGWLVTERPAGLFSHLFLAVREHTP